MHYEQQHILDSRMKTLREVITVIFVAAKRHWNIINVVIIKWSWTLYKSNCRFCFCIETLIQTRMERFVCTLCNNLNWKMYVAEILRPRILKLEHGLTVFWSNNLGVQSIIIIRKIIYFEYYFEVTYLYCKRKQYTVKFSNSIFVLFYCISFSIPVVSIVETTPQSRNHLLQSLAHTRITNVLEHKARVTALFERSGFLHYAKVSAPERGRGCVAASRRRVQARGMRA